MCTVVKGLVELGHNVRGTVRDKVKSGAHIEAIGAQVFEVKDMADQAALEHAFAGVDGIFHMAAVHPEYGFAPTAEGREALLQTAVEGTVTVLKAANAVGVKRVVLTSSLAAIECGNDEGVLTEAMWSKSEVYDSKAKLEDTQWSTHYTYVKSKVEQEKVRHLLSRKACAHRLHFAGGQGTLWPALCLVFRDALIDPHLSACSQAAVTYATEVGLDLRVVVPGNLCVGPIASEGINGTMTRLKDIVSGKNTLKGAADLAIVHVADVRATLPFTSGRTAWARYTPALARAL